MRRAWPNPFVPDGYRRTPNAPLSPLLIPAGEYRRWYLDVGGHRESGDAFREMLDDHCADLARDPRAAPPGLVRGQLVVAEGPERTGKSSLVEDLVERARHRFAACDVSLHRIDLRDLPSGARPVGVLDRDVCRGVRDRLRHVIAGDPPGGEPAPPEPGDPDGPAALHAFLTWVGLWLAAQGSRNPSNVAVLLPASPHDLTEPHPYAYGAAVPPGMLVFGERIAHGRPVRPDDYRGAGLRFPTEVYRLRPIGAGEIDRVIDARLRQGNPHPEWPSVTREAVEFLNRVNADSNGNTIGWTTGVLAGTYQRRIDGTSEFSGSDVTMAELLRHLELTAEESLHRRTGES